MQNTITRISSPPSSTVYGDQSNCACWPGGVSKRSVTFDDTLAAARFFRNRYTALDEPLYPRARNSRTMREPISFSPKYHVRICASNGTSFGFGFGGRSYFGASSRRNAWRTALRETPSSRQIARIDVPWACIYRIVVHASMRSTLLVLPVDDLHEG